jgi:rRNA biogenesis protein RRP5
VRLDRNFPFTLCDQTIMPKRVLDEGSSTQRAKKVKLTDKDKKSKAKEQPIEAPSKLTTEEVDFPRGGGSSFTPIEVKAIRAEALREADSELFKVCSL